MRQYLDLLDHLLENGTKKADRTGTGTLSVFGYQMRFDLTEGFPLLTTKKLHLRSIIHELIWFLDGDTNIKYLCENGVRIWNDWPYEKYRNSDDFAGEDIRAFADRVAADDDFAKKWGDLGPVYGAQWRSWPISGGGEVDQIKQLLDGIKNNPDSRRHLVCAWNVGEVSKMALPPCHCLFQFYVADGKLSCQLYQRSADTFLGVPFNIASYALLTLMIAQECGLEPGEFVHSFGDVHLYLNHVDQARLQLERIPKTLPQMKLNPEVKSVFDFRYEDFTLENYEPYPHIKAAVSV